MCVREWKYNKIINLSGEKRGQGQLSIDYRFYMLVYYDNAQLDQIIDNNGYIKLGPKFGNNVVNFWGLLGNKVPEVRKLV